METRQLDTEIIVALKSVAGIVDAAALAATDFEKLRELELEAGKNAFMGLGRLANTGVTEVLSRFRVYAALTSMDFDWGCSSALVLKKDDVLAGEEIRDEVRIAELKTQENVWFMHQNFVIYTDRINFPQDIMGKMAHTCRFEIPPRPADWLAWPAKTPAGRAPIFANPSPLGDEHLKTHYFANTQAEGLGTIIVGG